MVRFRAPQTGELSWSAMNLPTHVTNVDVEPSQTAIHEFVLIPQHTAPANTTQELEALYDVLQDVRKMWKTEVGGALQSQQRQGRRASRLCPHEQDVMLLGDFNADCAYLAKKTRKKLQLIADRNLHWLIADKTDTTVRASTSCAYDR